MKKICLIVDSSIEFSPYVKNYIQILDKNNLLIIEWNRLRLEKRESSDNNYVYMDSKSGHRKNYFQYKKYAEYIKEVLKNHQVTEFIIFGVQISFFLRNIIKNKKYVIDIRDYHPIVKTPQVKSVLRYASCVVLSSYGYKSFIPSNANILINHNFNIENYPIDEDSIKNTFDFNFPLVISSVGANRDLKINLKLIEILKNNEKFNLKYHGQSIPNELIQNYVKNKKINNVTVSGYYEKIDEKNFYFDSHMINSLRINKVYNNSVALPNKLYTSTLFSKPIITNDKSSMADIVYKYNLGFIVKNMKTIEKDIISYIKSFDSIKYLKGRRDFLDMVEKENNEFNKIIINLFKK